MDGQLSPPGAINRRDKPRVPGTYQGGGAPTLGGEEALAGGQAQSISECTLSTRKTEYRSVTGQHRVQQDLKAAARGLDVGSASALVMITANDDNGRIMTQRTLQVTSECFSLLCTRKAQSSRCCVGSGSWDSEPQAWLG